jgi:hypothetical protein
VKREPQLSGIPPCSSTARLVVIGGHGYDRGLGTGAPGARGSGC